MDQSQIRSARNQPKPRSGQPGAARDSAWRAVAVAGLGIFEIDLAAGTAHWSPRAREILSLAADAPTDIESLAARLDVQSASALREAWRRCIEKRDHRLTLTLNLPANGHVATWVQLSAEVGYNDAEGENGPARPVSVFGTLTDVKAARDHQIQLSNARGLETIGRLSGGIAHDFNNLLTVILSNLELAQCRIEDTDTRTLIDAALEATELGASFNRRLMSLARTEQGHPRVLRAERHMAEAHALLTRALGETVELSFDFGRDLWPVRIDAAELDGALLNLAVNARDAMPHGGSVMMRLRNVTLEGGELAGNANSRTGDFLRLEVTDTGSGMAEAELRQALEPFFTTKTSGRGTGLGLTSVASFAGHAGGFLTLESKPGQGTTVAIYLPRSTEAPAHDEDSSPDPQMPYGDGELVLVVEDDEMVRDTNIKRLELLGYAVLEARDADEALDIMRSGEPVELVFSDIVMPGTLNGYELAAKLRQEFPGTALLLTSGHASVKLRGIPGLRSRDVQFLSKPCTLVKLARAVSRVLHSE